MIVVVNVTNIVVTDFIVVDLNGGYFVRSSSKTAPTTEVADGEIMVDTVCDLFPDTPECLEPVVVEPTLPEPVLGTGDIQFTLRWSSTADLDLAVIDPSGEVISYSSPASSSGGQLDVDSNGNCSSAVTNPVENIFWPEGQSPDGVYQIIVTYYGECGSGTGPQTYSLDTLIGGVPVEVQTGFMRQASGTLPAVGSQDRKQVTKPAFTPEAPPPVDTVAPPVVPGTAAPVEQGATTTTILETPEMKCDRLYPRPEKFMFYTLCMHDPTVSSV